MKFSFLKQIFPAIVMTLAFAGLANADFINFTTTTSLGPSNAHAALNGQALSSLPINIPIAGNADFPNLSITVTSATSGGSALTDAVFAGVGTRFGITSGANPDGTNTDGTNNSLGGSEGFTFTFSEDVNISQAQFGSLGTNESINFGTFGLLVDDPANASDLYSFDLDVAAGEAFTISGAAGNVGIRTITFAPVAAVPEPSSVALLGLLGLGAVARRRR